MFSYRANIETYQTNQGNLNTRANITSVTYAKAGTYTCKAESTEASDLTRTSGTSAPKEQHVPIRVLCRK